nr:E91 [uncultured bacterium]
MDNSNNRNLHGSAPDNSQLALLLIDVINDFEFDEGAELLREALPAAENIARLKKRAEEAEIPVIYVNDNFGRWRSDFKKIVTHCLEDQVRGQPIAQLLAPKEEDYFVLKPKHSGFFSTTLDLLLEHLGVRTLIIVGFAGDNCVLFTANDAYMRDYELIIPADCTASNKPDENENALRQMQKVLKADIRPAAEIDFTELGKERLPGVRRPGAALGLILRDRG